MEGSTPHGSPVAEPTATSRRLPVAPLSDRINGEPIILRGLTSSEIMMSMAIFFPIWLVIGVVIGLLVHHLLFSIIFAVGGPLASTWYSAGYLARIKRNRPQHYHWHALWWWMHKLGFKSPFIAHEGPWELGRWMPASSGSRPRSKPRRSGASTTSQETSP